MGSSARKKKDKKKDFQKPKLKVGKTKPKAVNVTDTSFKSKGIVLSKQSISTSTPSLALQFAYHLSLLTHRSETQRRDSLAYLTTVVSARPVNNPLPQPVGIILPKLQPLILDGSTNVREQLLKLFRSLPADQVEDHVDQLLLYVRAGMTHLAVDIRMTAVEALEWLLEVAPQEVVGCPGGWIKTLKCFLALLGWQTDNTAKWSTGKPSFGKAGSGGKLLIKQLHALASFLKAGLGVSEEQVHSHGADSFPLWHMETSTMAGKSNGFAYLGLFGKSNDHENDMLEDREDRLRSFKGFQPVIESGLELAKKDGGEIGRAAAAVRNALKETTSAVED